MVVAGRTQMRCSEGESFLINKILRGEISGGGKGREEGETTGVPVPKRREVDLFGMKERERRAAERQEVI